MDLFKPSLSKQELLSRVGSIGQLAGAQELVCTDGKGKGASIIRVRNGKGLDFNILPDRGLDIFDAYLNGIPMAWISQNGLTSNTSYESQNLGWLRTFGGGMLVTCGLRNVGSPVTSGSEHFGLHGRYSSIPATKVNILEYWDGNIFHIEVSGEIRESNVFSENLVCRRAIKTNSAENKIRIHDAITNEGFRPEEFLVLYHFNWGYPLFSADSKLEISPATTSVRDSNATAESWNEFSAPIPGFREIVYLHKPKSDSKDNCSYRLLNQTAGIGVKVSWPKAQLPYLTQWKMMGQSEYVLGLEPGNCFPNGRFTEMENGRIDKLSSFETKDITLNLNFEAV